MMRDGGGCLLADCVMDGWVEGNNPAHAMVIMMYVSPPSIDPTPTLEPVSAAGRTIASRARGGIRTNQVHTRVRFAPALVGPAPQVSHLSVSIHFASLRPLESTLFLLSIRSQLPIIYRTYFAAYS